MAKGTKGSRCPKRSHEETMKAILDKEDDRIVWERIAQTICSRFPHQIRSADQCRRRWDILVKVYNHFEEYCIQTGQDHKDLDEDELTSVKLDTSYRLAWYNIVQQVCSHIQRKRNERRDRELVAAKQPKLRKGSNAGSHSVALPERTPTRDTLDTTPLASTSESVIPSLDTHHEQSTTDYAQVSTIPSLEDENLGLEEEVFTEKDALILDLAQLQPHGQTLEPTYPVQHTFPAGVGAQVMESLPDPLSDDWLWEWRDFEVVEAFSKIEQATTRSVSTGLSHIL